MSPVELFFGTIFISAEDADISFEVKAVLCLGFYALRDVFRSGIVRVFWTISVGKFQNSLLFLL